MTVYTPDHVDVNYRDGLLGTNSGGQLLDVYYPPGFVKPAAGWPVVAFINNTGLEASSKSGQIDTEAGAALPLKFKGECLARGIAILDVIVTTPGDGAGGGLFNNPDSANLDFDGGGYDSQGTDATMLAQWTRHNAATYGFDMTRSAIAGLSGGAHCAIFGCLGEDEADPANVLPVRRVSSRFPTAFLFNVGAFADSFVTDSAAGGPTNVYLRKASDASLVATDFDDAVADDVLEASHNRIMARAGARPLNARLKVYQFADGTPGAGALGTVDYTINPTTLETNWKGTPTEGLTDVHDPFGTITRQLLFNALDAEWHAANSRLTAENEWTIEGLTPAATFADNVTLSEDAVDWFIASWPTAERGGRGPGGAMWFNSDGLYPTFPTDGKGGSSPDLAACSIEDDDLVTVEGFYVDTVVGETPTITLVDASGATIFGPLTLPSGTVTGRASEILSAQRGVLDHGASEDSTDVQLSPSVSAPHSLPWITNVRYSEAGRTTPDATGLNNDDVSLYTAFSGAGENIVIGRLAASEDVDHRVAWATLDWSEAAGTDDEVIVRAVTAETLANGVATLTTPAISAIVDTTRCAVFLTGLANDRAAQSWDSVATRVVINGDKTLTLTRGNATGDLLVSLSVVEFTGSNWEIRTFGEVLSTAAGGRDPATLSASIPSWDNAFILGTYQIPTGEAGAEDSGMLFLKPESGTTTVDALLSAGADNVAGGGYISSGWVCYNPTITVFHDHSLTGGTIVTYPAGLQTRTDTIPAVDLDHTFAIVYAASGGVAAGTPAPCINYRLASSTTIEYWKGFTGAGFPAGLALQLVQTAAPGEETPVTGLGKAYMFARRGRGIEHRGVVGVKTNGLGTAAKVFFRNHGPQSVS